jgi:hypothetical protein
VDALDPFGTLTLGRYNLLPKKTKVPYQLGESVLLPRLPDIAVRENPGPHPRYLATPAWDHTVLKEEVNRELPWEEGYRLLAERTKGHWRDGTEFSPEDVARVHSSGLDFPGGWLHGLTQHYERWYGDAAAAVGFREMHGHSPVAFVGRLVGVAPYVCGTGPVQGPTEKTYADDVRVSVTSTDDRGREFSLTADIGIGLKDAEVKRTASFHWSKAPTGEAPTDQAPTGEAALVPPRGGETTLTVPQDTWGRVDVRACAGVYSGWMAYQTSLTGKPFYVYPMRVPLHAPACAGAVAAHVMTAPAERFSAQERALTAAYTRAEDLCEAVLQRLTQGKGHPLATEDTERLLAGTADRMRLADAMAVLRS